MGIGNRDWPRLRGDMAEELNRAGRIKRDLTAEFPPAELLVTDDSAHHAGHAGSAGGAGQTHYSVLLVSLSFQGMSRVARSRAVHGVLADEFGAVEGGGMHALALTLRTPDEHERLKATG